MRNLILAFIIAVGFIVSASASSFTYDNIRKDLLDENANVKAYAMAYFIGLYDSLKVNENISEKVYGVKSRKFCFDKEPPKMFPTLLHMMDDYRENDRMWDTNDQSYELLVNDPAYVMTWTLIYHNQCEHNIN
tara:strand:+ start:25 stop:423 length:399 start_codon:yes stop_codon:yes gene_type:complete